MVHAKPFTRWIAFLGGLPAFRKPDARPRRLLLSASPSCLALVAFCCRHFATTSPSQAMAKSSAASSAGPQG